MLRRLPYIIITIAFTILLMAQIRFAAGGGIALLGPVSNTDKADELTAQGHGRETDDSQASSEQAAQSRQARLKKGAIPVPGIPRRPENIPVHPGEPKYSFQAEKTAGGQQSVAPDSAGQAVPGNNADANSQTAQSSGQSAAAPAASSQDGTDTSGKFIATSNVGEIGVGFGENAPASVPNRVGMPKADGVKDSIFSGMAPSSGNMANDETGLPGADTDRNYMLRHTLHRNPAQTGGQSDAVQPGLSESRMRSRSQARRQTANDYERCLLALMRLNKRGGSLSITPAQARHILQLIDRTESNQDTEQKAFKTIDSVLNSRQKAFIEHKLSNRPVYTIGPSQPQVVRLGLREILQILDETAAQKPQNGRNAKKGTPRTAKAK